MLPVDERVRRLIVASTSSDISSGLLKTLGVICIRGICLTRVAGAQNRANTRAAACFWILAKDGFLYFELVGGRVGFAVLFFVFKQMVDKAG